MLYLVTLVSILLVWLFDATGVFPRLIPHIFVRGADIGFYLAHLVLFTSVWFLLWFLREAGLLRRAAVENIESRQGTSRFMDILILLAVLLCGAAAIGAGTVSPYLKLMLLLGFLSAGYSLLRGHEYSRRRPDLSTVNISSSDADDSSTVTS